MSGRFEPLGKLTRIRESFCRALDRPAGERAAFLTELAPEIRDEVLSLLAAYDAAGPFLTFPDRAALSTGERIGPYSVMELIGQGGMGEVYRARRDDGEFQREVAIKLVGGRLFAPEGERRFISERRILALLDHPNIVRMIDGGVWHGQRYLVMELVSGEPITSYCERRKLTVTERLRIFQAVCAAVLYAHQHLVLHRDLKPSNILITPQGQVKLLDFGIARLVDDSAADDAGTTLLNPLTLSCASPEQVRGEALTLASDIYSLGLLLYELVSGRNPQSSGTRLEIEQRILAEDPVAPSKLSPISADLDAIVLKALAKDQAWRYPSVERLSADIDCYLNGQPVSARAGSLFYRSRKFIRRRAVPLAAVSSIVAALLLGALSTLAQWRRADRRFVELRSLAHSVLYDIYDAIGGSPGTLPARRLLAARAQEYLDNLAREVGGDSGLIRELAETYLRLGDVQGRPYVANLGNTAGALESYRKAVALLEREAARRPNDDAIQEALRAAYSNISSVLLRQRDHAASSDAARKAIAIAESVSKRNPQSVVYGEHLADAYRRLGMAQSVAAQQGGSLEDLKQVLATFQRALAILNAAGPSSERTWRAGLRTTYSYISYAYQALGDRTGDVNYYRQALDAALNANAMSRDLAAVNPSQENRRNVADGLADIGVFRWKCCRDLEGAIRDEEEAQESFRGIAEQDRQNLEAKRDIANAHYYKGIIYEYAGRRREALRESLEALAVYEGLGRIDPTSGENASDIAAIRARIAELERNK